jgi:membrane protease YdiL (CAAX protease family)
MRALIRRHPAASYFLLAIALSWSGVLATVWGGSFPASAADAERLFTRVYLAMLVGPSVGGLAITVLVNGSDGLHAYRERLLTWRIDARWYVVSLLTAPVAIALTLLAVSIVSPAFVPTIISGRYAAAPGPIPGGSATAFALTGLAVGIGAGLFEELGWTGVAVPKMLARHGTLATGVGVGLVWGGWHYLAIYWGSADAMGPVPAWVYLCVALFSFLPPYRVLMVWVYQHTRSLPIGILMHASLTASMLLLGPPVSGRDLLMYDLVLAAILWIAAAVVLTVERLPRRTHASSRATESVARASARRPRVGESTFGQS